MQSATATFSVKFVRVYFCLFLPFFACLYLLYSNDPHFSITTNTKASVADRMTEVRF